MSPFLQPSVIVKPATKVELNQIAQEIAERERQRISQMGERVIYDLNHYVELYGEGQDGDCVDGSANSWRSYVDWKDLRSKGITHMQVGTQLYTYTKWGLNEEVGQ